MYRLIVCGGTECFGFNDLDVRSQRCWSWSPTARVQEWREEPEMMTQPRAAHILGYLPDGRLAAMGGDGEVFDDEFTIEARNDATGEWEYYSDISNRMAAQDNGVSCMVQVRCFICKSAGAATNISNPDQINSEESLFKVDCSRFQLVSKLIVPVFVLGTGERSST